MTPKAKKHRCEICAPPPKGTGKIITLRMEEEELEHLRSAAKLQNMTMVAFVRHALHEALGRWEEEYKADPEGYKAHHGKPG